MKEIPIMFCFNNNYVIPASACFISIMENSNIKNRYIFYVLHTDITEANQKKLKEDLKKYKNCTLNFIYMDNQYEELFKKIPNHSHFSKELLYKLNCATIFSEEEKIIISDVDVIFLNDIAKIYEELNVNSNYYYAGIPPIKKKNKNIYSEELYKKFSKEEIQKLNNGIGAGYLVLNLKKIREENMVQNMLNYLEENSYKLVQIEQDVINIVCANHIKHLPYYYMVCSYEYDDFSLENYEILLDKTEKKEVKYALENPVQLHFATSIKPWKYIDCTKSEIWFQYFFQTSFCREYLKELPKNKKSVKSFSTKFMKTKLYKFMLWWYHVLKKILNLILNRNR